MSSQEIKFRDKKGDKREFYLSKKAIPLDSVNLDKIVVSNKWKINDKTCKYICGYLNNGIIQPLCVILPQMNGYIKYFEAGAKNMSFVTGNEKIYEKYNEIWDVIKKLLKLKFTVDAIRDNKYLIAKVKVLNGMINTTFTSNHMHAQDEHVPAERNRYLCIPAIDIDSVLKVDGKVYPQVYLEQCKYKLKKRRPADFVDLDIIDEDSDSD